ncbi:hypothetical protein [Sphingobacterium faecium]|uniref:hypothetical protein n=1 Tax=Sphingobacterium faecium TaxID=34087 RepID=UPI003209B970
MKIYQNDYQEILDYLVDQRWQGMEFVAFNTGNGPVHKEGLLTCWDRSEARELCAKYSTDEDKYDWLAVRSVYRCMSEALYDKCLLIEKNGVVDIAAMVSLYYDRLDKKNANVNKDLEQLEQKGGFMNQKNFEYLIKQMFYAGLGEVPVADLQKKLQEGKEDFQLIHQKKFGNDNVTARLNFKRSEQDINMYFFNSFDVLFKKEGERETMQQNFRISYGNDFRFDEAYKLMNGRSVHKTFVMTDRLDKDIRQELEAMVYMDFKNPDKYGNFEIVKVYGYDLEKKLAEYPIKDLDNEAVKNKIVTDLKRGEVATVTVATSKGEQEMRITANAQFDKLNLFDTKMKPIGKSAINEIQNGETIKQDTSKSQSKKQNESKQVEGSSKIIKKPEASDKNPSLRVG